MSTLRSDPAFNIRFARRIWKQLKRKGWEQSRLADHLDIPRSSISRLLDLSGHGLAVPNYRKVVTWLIKVERY